MDSTKVLLVGYGSQGTRIADAVLAQQDVQLLGIGLKEPDLFARMASRKEIAIYVPKGGDADRFREAKVDVEGTYPDVFPEVDVVIDATPGGVGITNRDEFYSRYGVKAVFQAGEALDVAEIPAFVSTINYEEARHANSVRIPSPFTVSMVRTLAPLNHTCGIENVVCTLIRPGSEPMRGRHGPLDTIVLDDPYSSQEKLREELNLLFPTGLLFTSLAIPSLLIGAEVLTANLKAEISGEYLIGHLSCIPRTILLREGLGLHSTDSVFEYIRRVVRPPGDIYEVCIWRDHVEVLDQRLKMIQAYDPHCVQTPEVIDAVRALAGSVDMEESFRRTNKALGIPSPGTQP